jgi:hypothetical protein
LEVTPGFSENLWTPAVTFLKYIILDIGNSQSDVLKDKFLTCSTQKLFHPKMLLIYIGTPFLVEQLEMYLPVKKQ